MKVLSISHFRANNSSYNAEDIKTDDAAGGFYPQAMADYALPFSLSGMWKKKADVLPPETLHQVCSETGVAPSSSDNVSIDPLSPYRLE